MFETSGKIDIEFFKELKPHLFPKKTKYSIIALSVISLILAVLSFVFKRPQLSVLLVFLTVFLIAEYIFIANKNVKIMLGRISETLGTPHAEYTVSFDENGVVVENHSTGAKSDVKYDSFKRLEKCRSYYVLFTKSSQFVPIFLDCLSDTQKVELLNHLKTHIPKLKV